MAVSNKMDDHAKRKANQKDKSKGLACDNGDSKI